MYLTEQHWFYKVKIVSPAQAGLGLKSLNSADYLNIKVKSPIPACAGMTK
jgi:hypothetical protein